MAHSPWMVPAGAGSFTLDSTPITTRMSGYPSFQIKLGIS
jgi:hypothetical protein